jgi:hypothetical protein
MKLRMKSEQEQDMASSFGRRKGAVLLTEG